MGLFNKVTDIDTSMNGTRLSPAEAFACVALVAIAADGYLSEQESQDMTMMLSRMRLFESYSKDLLHSLLDKLLRMLKQYGPETLISQAKAAMPPDLRDTAFAIATDLVLSDRTVTPQEQAFLDDLYRILEVPGDTALQIVQVMTIKNRG